MGITKNTNKYIYIFICDFSYSQINWHVKVATELGNPFLATAHELAALGTYDVMENVVAMSLSKISEVEKTLHSEYVDTRLTNDTVPFSCTIKINRLFTFSNRSDTRKKGEKAGMIKQNTTLITQLFISLQSRPEADMVDFFNMKTNENPLLYRIVVCFERETSQI